MYLDLLRKNGLKIMISQVVTETSMLRSDLRDYRVACIVKGTITVIDPDNSVYDEKLAF